MDSFLRATDPVSGPEPDPLTTNIAVGTSHATSELELFHDDDVNKSQPGNNSFTKVSVDKSETSNNDNLDTQGSVDADQNNMKLHLVELVPTVSDDPVDWVINDVTIEYLFMESNKIKILISQNLADIVLTENVFYLNRVY